MSLGLDLERLRETSVGISEVQTRIIENQAEIDEQLIDANRYELSLLTIILMMTIFCLLMNCAY